jgi:hypothetical protein
VGRDERRPKSPCAFRERRPADALASRLPLWSLPRAIRSSPVAPSSARPAAPTPKWPARARLLVLGQVVTDLNNLARLLQATNRLAEAELLMRRAGARRGQLRTTASQPREGARLKTWSKSTVPHRLIAGGFLRLSAPERAERLDGCGQERPTRASKGTSSTSCGCLATGPNAELCAVAALERWLTTVGATGPVFWTFDHLRGRLTENRLDSGDVARILRRRAAAGVVGHFAWHSPAARFITNAVDASAIAAFSLWLHGSVRRSLH